MARPRPGSKETTVFVLDVGYPMAASNMAVAEGQSDLEAFRPYVYSLIGAKVASGRKTDYVGVVGVGTEESAVELDEGYEHISVLHPLKQFLLSDFRTLPSQLIPPSTDDVQGDIISGLLIALKMTGDFCQHKKFIKNIEIVSNCNSSADFSDMEEIAAKIAKDGVSLRILTVGIGPDDLNQKNDKITALQRDNYAKLQEFVRAAKEANVEIQLLDYEDIYRKLDQPTIKKTASVSTYRGLLTLGDYNGKFEDEAIAIDVQRFLYIQRAVPPSTKAYREEAEDSAKPRALEWETKYFVRMKEEEDEDGEKEEGEKEEKKKKAVEAPKGDLKKAYRYGRSLVTFEDDEYESLRYTADPCLEIIGFVTLSDFKPWMLMSPSSFIVATENDPAVSALALSSLIHAMKKSGLYAIARFVPRSGDPRMVALVPDIDIVDGQRKFEGLVQTELPFAEDVRDYRFSSLKTVRTIKGKVLTKHHRLPTDEMVDAMRQYVKAMDISRLADGLPAAEEDPEGQEYVAPGKQYNPVNARIQRAILDRAIDPKAPIPKLSESLVEDSQPPPYLVDAVSDIARHLIEVLNVKKVEKRESLKAKDHGEGVKRKAAELDLEALLEGSRKRSRVEEERFDIVRAIGEWNKLEVEVREAQEKLVQIFTRAGEYIMNLLESEETTAEEVLGEVRLLKTVAQEMDEKGWYEEYLTRLVDAQGMSGRWAGLEAEIEAEGLREFGGE
ncbi:SPOC like C-terminal domain-containing protein [Myxozyma melibiosi]|uniref:ATP-dependent DNA helicase II subunit 2 n=1 Tax=Myxozyma melibiosi TaxID=54550 RepID=A0ABR1F0B7_9ASCO